MKKIKWIDCAKFIAIIAVLVDHTEGILYHNNSIAIGSYFSVSLFIIISGMLMYISNEKHQLKWIDTFARSSKKIVMAYLIANLVYLLWIDKFLDIKKYCGYVMHFNLSGPFYYVFLYLQLMLVSRFLFDLLNKVVKKYGFIGEGILGGFVLLFGAWATNYTNILDIYGGGGKLLGGTYLFLFYIGMVFSKHHFFENRSLKRVILFTLSGILLWFVWWNFECRNQFGLDSKLPFGNGLNPPSISSSVMAIIVLCSCFGIFSLLLYIPYLKLIVNFVAWLGKHTLYIFLYHRFFLDYILVLFDLQTNCKLRSNGMPVPLLRNCYSIFNGTKYR